MQLVFDGSVLVAKRRAAKREEKFGPRLARLRQARGLTQEELGTAIGISNRMVAYYERDDAEAPGPLLPVLAQTLKVTTDELLGVAPIRDGTTRKTARLLKRLRKVSELPPADQRTVLKLVDALHETRRRNAQ